MLASRGIELSEGEPAGEPDAETESGLGNAKNAVFNRMLGDEDVVTFPGTVALLDELADRGVKVAVVSSSRKAREVLSAAHLADRFPAVVDGEVARHAGLRGKPSPETFEHAAAALGVLAALAVVIEDAVSGVAAPGGRAGSVWSSVSTAVRALGPVIQRHAQFRVHVLGLCGRDHVAGLTQ